MAHGPGEYDNLCEEMLQRTDADCVVILVLGGQKGSGWSFNAKWEALEKATKHMPQFLEKIAESIKVDENELRRASKAP